MILNNKNNQFKSEIHSTHFLSIGFEFPSDVRMIYILNMSMLIWKKCRVTMFMPCHICVSCPYPCFLTFLFLLLLNLIILMKLLTRDWNWKPVRFCVLIQNKIANERIRLSELLPQPSPRSSKTEDNCQSPLRLLQTSYFSALDRWDPKKKGFWGEFFFVDSIYLFSF